MIIVHSLEIFVQIHQQLRKVGPHERHLPQAE
jgi:hypothetical protein